MGGGATGEGGGATGEGGGATGEGGGATGGGATGEGGGLAKPGPECRRREVVTLRLFAAARAAAGTALLEVPVGTDLVPAPPAAIPVVDVVATATAAMPPRFAEVLAVCTLIADGRRLDHASQELLPAGTVIDVLPPFAGG